MDLLLSHVGGLVCRLLSPHGTRTATSCCVQWWRTTHTCPMNLIHRRQGSTCHQLDLIKVRDTTTQPTLCSQCLTMQRTPPEGAMLMAACLAQQLRFPADLRNVLRTLKFSHLWQDDRYEKYVFGDPQILNQMMVSAYVDKSFLTGGTAYLLLVHS